MDPQPKSKPLRFLSRCVHRFYKRYAIMPIALAKHVKKDIAMQRLFAKKQVLLLLCAGFILLGCVYVAYGLYVPSDCDGVYRWRESAYVLHGIDPFAITTGRIPPLPQIGLIQGDGGNMPWTYLLSNVIYPGFLPYSSALLWARGLFVALLGITIWRVWRTARRVYSATTLQALALVSVLFACYMWFATLRLGNHAAYVTLLIFLLLTFDHSRHWALAGLCYAFLLIKPQTSGLLLLYFLLTRRWKPILFAGGLLLAITAATSVIIRTSPITMLQNVYALAVSLEHNTNYAYYGLLDPLVSLLHVPASIVLPAGMLLGIGATTLFALRWRVCNEAVNYAVVCLLCMSWMYLQHSDSIALGVVGFASLSLLFSVPLRRTQACTLALGAVLGAVPVLGVWYMASPIVPLLMRVLYGLVVVTLVLAQRGFERAAALPSTPNPCTSLPT